MARLTKAEAARHLKCSRTFVYTMIEHGILQVLPDGKISAEECARVQLYVDTHGKGRTARERPRTDPRLPLVPALSHAPLPPDMYADSLARIEGHLAALTVQVAALTSLLQRDPAPSRPPPAAYAQITAYLAQYPDGRTIKDMKRDLGINNVKNIAQSMARYGKLQRREWGVYALPREQEDEAPQP